MAKYSPDFKVGDNFIHRNFNGRRARGVVTKVGSSAYANPDYEADIQLEDGRVAHRVTVSESDMIAANSAHSSTNPVVQNAIKARNGVACNTSELEVSLSYAGRLQSELRDVARSGNGRVSSSNTVEFPTEDDAEDAMEYLIRYAHVPKGEVWINSKATKAASNSAVAANAIVKVGLQKLLHSLSKAKTDIGASLEKFNEEDWGDEYKWAQKVNKSCDNVARAINVAVLTLGS